VCRLKDGLCWTDADCAKGEHCNNLVNCGPSTNCPGPYSCVTDAQCKTDKDCPAIPMPLGCDGSGKCVSGQCVYECQPVCVKDADCGEGMRCLQPGDDCCSGAYCDPSWPMCGTCAPAEVECKADSDCKAGEFCDHSAWADKVGCCVPTDPSGAGCPSDFPVCPGVCRLKDGLCWTDADCAAGTHCQDDVNCGPDMNCMGPYTCVPDPVTKCATDKDCGGCAVCIAGECKGLGEVECLADKDCADGEYCMVYEGMPCKNRCASKKCWVVDCAGNCDPVTNPCANGQQCVEPIKGCCGVCQ
jgi:Cys-rich repeat protein